MTPKQRRWYFGLCKKAVAIEMHGRQTWTKAEEEQVRHDITRRALGCDKSSTIFTQRDFDRVIQQLQKIVNPDSLDAQLRQIRQASKRATWVVRQLMKEIGVDENYVRGVIEQIDNGFDPNSTDTWQRERERNFGRRRLEDLTADDLHKVIDALRAIKGRRGRKVREYILKPA